MGAAPLEYGVRVNLGLRVERCSGERRGNSPRIDSHGRFWPRADHYGDTRPVRRARARSQIVVAIELLQGSDGCDDSHAVFGGVANSHERPFVAGAYRHPKVVTLSQEQRPY